MVVMSDFSTKNMERNNRPPGNDVISILLMSKVEWRIVGSSGTLTEWGVDLFADSGICGFGLCASAGLCSVNCV